MESCKDCIHHKICRIAYHNGDDRVLEKSPCAYYKNKADLVEVKRGEWKASVMSTGAPHCSLCNGVAPSRFTYCPRCGAKMDKENTQ